MNELAENELFNVRERMKRIKREENSNDYALDHRRSLAQLHSVAQVFSHEYLLYRVPNNRPPFLDAQWVCMSHKNFFSKHDNKTIDKLLVRVKPIRNLK